MRIRPFPPILINVIHTALRSCEGVRFFTGNTCDTCGGTLSGYDERKKRFALLVEEDKTCPVHVVIRRSACRSCGKIVVPEDPFYPNTRFGSPVVDLCRSLSLGMPCARVSTSLRNMGVLVDRWTVRQYARMPLPDIPMMELFGMQIPVSILSLSTLAGTLGDRAYPDMEEVLTACKYPSRIPHNPKRSVHNNEEVRS